MPPPAMPDDGTGHQSGPPNPGAPHSGAGEWQPNGQPPQAGPGHPGTPPPQPAGYPYTDPGQYPAEPTPQQAGYPHTGPGQYPANPITGVPQQPGHPYTDPRQQPVPGLQPLKQSKTGWVIGIIAIVVVLAATGGTLFAAGVFGGGIADGDVAEDSAPENAGDQPRYISPDTPCLGLDFDLSGFEKHAPADGGVEEASYETNSNAEDAWHCAAEFKNDETWIFGELSVIAHFYRDADDAERQFENHDTWLDNAASGMAEANGEWNQGMSAAGDSEERKSQQIVVQDGNLFLLVYFEATASYDELGDITAEEFLPPANEMATQVMDQMRA